MIQNVAMLNLLKKLDQQQQFKDYLFVLYGRLDQEMVVSAIQLIELKMKLEQFSKATITRTKIICIEILQNIVKHQEQHDQIFPYFVLGTNEKALQIMAGNVITINDREIISDKLSKFIHLDESCLREEYKNAIKNAQLTPEGNAGIGLYDIVYRSNKNLSFQFECINSNLYAFNLNVSIN